MQSAVEMSGASPRGLQASKREPHGSRMHSNPRENEIHAKKMYKKHAMGIRTVDSDG